MATLNLTRKTTKSVLKSLTKIVDDLTLIANEENSRIAVNAIKIEKLNEENSKHRQEYDTALKVAANISKLLGMEEVSFDN